MKKSELIEELEKIKGDPEVEIVVRGGPSESEDDSDDSDNDDDDSDDDSDDEDTDDEDDGDMTLPVTSVEVMKMEDGTRVIGIVADITEIENEGDDTDDGDDEDEATDDED